MMLAFGNVTPRMNWARFAEGVSESGPPDGAGAFAPDRHAPLSQTPQSARRRRPPHRTRIESRLNSHEQYAWIPLSTTPRPLSSLGRENAGNYTRRWRQASRPAAAIGNWRNW